MIINPVYAHEHCSTKFFLLFKHIPYLLFQTRDWGNFFKKQPEKIAVIKDMLSTMRREDGAKQESNLRSVTRNECRRLLESCNPAFTSYYSEQNIITEAASLRDWIRG